MASNRSSRGEIASSTQDRCGLTSNLVVSEGTVAVPKALLVSTVMVMVGISVYGVGIRGQGVVYTALIRSMRSKADRRARGQ